jgi:hypothetical protein
LSGPAINKVEKSSKHWLRSDRDLPHTNATPSAGVAVPDLWALFVLSAGVFFSLEISLAQARL